MAALVVIVGNLRAAARAITRAAPARWRSAIFAMRFNLSRRFTRAFHFASPAYQTALTAPPTAADRTALRRAALKALSNSDATKARWHAEPVSSLLNNKALTGGARVETVDAFGTTNGAQLLASADEMAALTTHATSFAPPRVDLRDAVRRVEASLLAPDGPYAGVLIANQTLDFGKQDGVTEIEEAIQANPVEQRLNDELWSAEGVGAIAIPRRTILVPCVSNFSHFLDMCRKTLRSIELGIPVMVLSRSHTSQYPYRWVEALSSELAAAGVDPGYLSFCSADLPNQQALIKAVADAAKADPSLADAAPTPFLFTGARDLAHAIKRDVCEGVIASTQGPNLMVALGLPKGVATAAAMSATIENSGQCTAMRVLVAPAANLKKQSKGGYSALDQSVESLFELESYGCAHTDNAPSFLAHGQFAGLLDPPPTNAMGKQPTTPSGYTTHPVSWDLVPCALDATGHGKHWWWWWWWW